MANPEHLAILEQGVEAWNQWREENPRTRPDLRGADLAGEVLSGVNLRDVDLFQANLTRAILTEANLYKAMLRMGKLREADLRGAFLGGAHLGGADLRGADLRQAKPRSVYFQLAGLKDADLSGADLRWSDFRGADLSRTDVRGADLRGANLRGVNLSEAKFNEADLSLADLSGANLTEADLTEANLVSTILVRTDFTKAILTGVQVYGISAWDLELTGATQQDLVVTPRFQPSVTVDNLEVAQFIYLILNNEKIREVIDTITSKAVLILGRFTEERKVVLDAIRDELRKRNYLPILFDFDGPASRGLTETITTLARMSRFIIADLTDPRSIPHELQAIVPDLPSVPVCLIIQKGESEYGMIEHLSRYPWVLETYEYENTGHLLASLSERVIDPAESKAEEVRPR